MEKQMEPTDELLHITLNDGQVRALVCRTTGAVQAASDIHHATPVCAAAMGRLLTGTVMLGVMMKDEGSNVTVTVKGGGPAGSLIAVAHGSRVKAAMDNPQVTLPLKPSGKLDVSGAVGTDGRMSVVKDMALREPYIGQVNLVSGEIADDFALYFTASEQQPSLIALGVLTAGERILSAGGILVQPLPGCDEDVLNQLELRSPMFADISRELLSAPMETLVEGWFDGMAPQIIARQRVDYGCDCSRRRMEKALISMGRGDLVQIIEDAEGAELTCHFCHSHYQFSTADLQALLAQAQAAN